MSPFISFSLIYLDSIHTHFPYVVANGSRYTLAGVERGFAVCYFFGVREIEFLYSSLEVGFVESADDVEESFVLDEGVTASWFQVAVGNAEEVFADAVYPEVLVSFGYSVGAVFTA